MAGRIGIADIKPVVARGNYPARAVVAERIRIEATGQRSHLFEITSSLYDMLGADALRFFYPMRSGTPILDSLAPGYGRPAGHLGQPPNLGDLEVRAWTAALPGLAV